MRRICEYPAPAELLEVDVELDMELVASGNPTRLIRQFTIIFFASGLAVLCRSAQERMSSYCADKEAITACPSS